VKLQHLSRLSLVVATIGALLQAGAQLFAVAVIVSTAVEAPPRSLAIYAGEYGYDSSHFWEIMPTINLALLFVALLANWKTPRRRFVLVAVTAFVIAGLFAAFVTGPLQSEIISAGFSESVDPALKVRAARWYIFDWTSWALTLVPGLVLVFALSATSSESARVESA